MSRRPLLGIVDPSTGEIVSCPQCQQREDALQGLERDLRVKNAKIKELERDVETDARKDPMWDEAECLHTWWRLACWYPGTKFDADDFWLVKKHLKRAGLVACLQSVCGAAYDPWVSTLKNGREKRHNGWKKIWESKAMMEDFAERVPGQGDEWSGEWRRWLVTRIESNLVR